MRQNKGWIIYMHGFAGQAVGGEFFGTFFSGQVSK